MSSAALPSAVEKRIGKGNNVAIISRIQLYQQTEQNVLSIRERLNFSDYPAFAGKAFMKIMTHAQANGWIFSGEPFACFHNTDLVDLDVEVGFPFAGPVAGDGDISVAHTIPARAIVAGIFLGPYEETDLLLTAIYQWMNLNGFTQSGPIFHYFMNDESSCLRSELLTRIVIPVKST